MSELTDSLRAHGQRHLGTELGGLLQWAALHIDAQDEALAELREEYAREKSDRVGLEGAMGAAQRWRSRKSTRRCIARLPTLSMRPAKWGWENRDEQT